MRNKRKTINFIVGLLITLGLVLLGGWLLWDSAGERPGSAVEEQEVDTSDWVTYENESFGFSIDHPPDWQVAEILDHPITPRINIYPSAQVAAEPPFTHHDSVTQVSVFPQGIPTEGVMGEWEESAVDFRVAVEESRDYLLSDEVVFATYAKLGAVAEGWNESGFLFSRVEISDLETRCLRNGDPIAPDQHCQPLTGDTLIRQGFIEEEVRAIQEKMLASFRLNEQTDKVTEYQDLIRVNQPSANEVVESPFTITGEARGTWYFEGDFPVRIEDDDGNELGRHFVTAQGDWMSEEYVPFSGELSFDTPSTDTGLLILEKSNPSGLPENADQVEIPVRFSLDNDTDREQTVTLYYYSPEADTDESGNIRCSQEGLVPVEREIPVTQTPIQDTVKLLLAGEITSAEAEQGIETEYPLEGFALTGANLSDGVLTLSFVDPNHQTSGGSCRTGVLWLQIQETAKQFEAVDEVRFQPDELFQP